MSVSARGAEEVQIFHEAVVQCRFRLYFRSFSAAVTVSLIRLIFMPSFRAAAIRRQDAWFRWCCQPLRPAEVYAAVAFRQLSVFRYTRW